MPSTKRKHWQWKSVLPWWMGNKVNCLFLIHVFFFLSNKDGFLDATSAESRYMNVVDSLSKFPFISRSYDCDESCSKPCCCTATATNQQRQQQSTLVSGLDNTGQCDSRFWPRRRRFSCVCRILSMATNAMYVFFLSLPFSSFLAFVLFLFVI